MDWSIREGLYNRFKLWKQQCELLFSGPLVKLEEPIQCNYLLYWPGERSLELFNSWDLSEDEQKILRERWSLRSIPQISFQRQWLHSSVG